MGRLADALNAGVVVFVGPSAAKVDRTPDLNSDTVFGVDVVEPHDVQAYKKGEAQFTLKARHSMRDNVTKISDGGYSFEIDGQNYVLGFGSG